MCKKIILVGAGGSGKDYARKILEKYGLTYAPMYTSRPKRMNEINGKDYFYISEESFLEKYNNNEFYTENKYPTTLGYWYYGTHIKMFNNDKYDLFIMTPFDIKQIKDEDREDCIIVYFNIVEDIRRKRLNTRNDIDSAERRLASDKKDFMNFTNYDIEITSHDFNELDLTNTIFKYIDNVIEQLYVK